MSSYKSNSYIQYVCPFTLNSLFSLQLVGFYDEVLSLLLRSLLKKVAVISKDGM